jgi:hypothetical protein
MFDYLIQDLNSYGKTRTKNQIRYEVGLSIVYGKKPHFERFNYFRHHRQETRTLSLMDSSQ